MNRDDAAEFVGERYAQYLAVVERDAEDSSGNLKAPIDDALRALGFVAAELATAETDGEEADEDFRVQVAYRAMAQISRDLGATTFDISTKGTSLKLSQLRAAAVGDLAEAKAAVLERFGTLGIVPSGEEESLFITIDTNYLADNVFEESWA